MPISVICLECGLLPYLNRFGSRWDAMESPTESELLDFVMQKLLDGPTSLAKDNRPGSLTCLSVQFGLKFNMDGTAHDIACAQVERHMRLCIAATTGLESLVTIARSEPLLADAAYRLLKGTKMTAVRHLADHLDLNCIDRGRRDELVAALLGNGTGTPAAIGTPTRTHSRAGRLPVFPRDVAQRVYDFARVAQLDGSTTP
jgi:hypothetical protein